MHGTHDVTNLVSYAWQSSWLGNFYEPTNSPLIDHGSTTADQFGLYHFTTQTNQVKETNSVVDIGYHYVALDTYGNPIDTDGDGVPDYLEDSNGNEMRFKIVILTGAILFLMSTIFAADKQIVFELRVPKTVDVSHGTFEFVGEKTAEGHPLKSAVTAGDGSRSFRQTVVLSTLYRERHYAVIISPSGGKGMSQVFRLPIRQNSKSSDWSQWQRPDYLEDAKSASSNFMDNTSSPDRSTHIPSDSFEIRFMVEASPGL
jgi:hypothetical protein